MFAKMNNLPVSRADILEPLPKAALVRAKDVLMGKTYAALLEEAESALSASEDSWLDATLRNPNQNTALSQGYVYLISAEQTPYFKIGVTVDLKNRLTNLNVGSFAPLKICAFAAVKSPYEIESKLHQKYAEFWEKGEWFVFPNGFLPSVKEIFEELQKSKGEGVSIFDL